MSQITAERVEQSITVIRLVNPPEGFLTPGMLPALETTFAAAAADPTVRVIVLTGGVTRVFVQHFWDPQMRATDGVPDSFPRKLRALCARIEKCDKPVIAAINGTCLGGGLELALACDLRVAQAGLYSIGTTEIHLGVLPSAGGVAGLVRLLGAARAYECIALGMTFTPEVAAARGLVTFVATHALEASLVLARRLTAQPARALAHLKALVRCESPDVHENEVPLLELWKSREAEVRMSAFNRGEFDVRDGYRGAAPQSIAPRTVEPFGSPPKRPRLRSV
ncbi:MAG TPA: enoyl-CoA hydratase/isomerase family protein [Steroidobacteraceae bacterium]|nr:enoyl-CoA hydratase/isomerase family protein [Steroidobacteraceae bacterium]